MSLHKALDDQALGRRVEFLLNEARQDIPVRDQAITFTMRAITNYLSIGKDCKSAYLSLKCPHRSRSAQASYISLVGSGPWARGELLRREHEWRKGVMNEHQEPLAQVWQWLIQEKHNVALEDVIDRFRMWPVVVVTKQENNDLRRRSNLGPKERYAGIVEVLTLVGNNWVPRSEAT
ncbi:MAG: hypothetical protein Q8Q62_04460 [Mesorhizobium sp.]|nr:hypothetical protein [Mesorhizobium sp.]